MIFNLIIIRFPLEDKEELQKAEEKIEEDLKEESKDTETKTAENQMKGKILMEF